MKKKYKSNDPYELADLSWGLIVFLWLCWWPLGAGLTIGKLIHQKKRQEANRYISASPYNYRPAADARQQRGYEGTLRAETAAPPQPRPNVGVDIPSPEQSKAAQKRGWLTPFLLVMGALLGLGGLSVFLEGVEYLLHFAGSMWPITDNIIPGLLMTAGGGAMFRTGLHNRKTAKQEELLDTIVGPRSNVTLDELSAASGLGKKETLKVVQSAIAHGRFGGDAYVDMATRTLVVRGAAPAAPKPAQPKTAAKQPAKHPKEDKYQAILRQLRQANDAIPGREMSEKIDRMELVSARIFELAKQDPGKECQLTRFMDYYLPTALKLLNTYAELDRPGLTGENISETKAGIEQAMTMLVTAFENQLDKLYESDALDVSSEISALQGMLSLDGLAPNADFDTSPTL